MTAPTDPIAMLIASRHAAAEARQTAAEASSAALVASKEANHHATMVDAMSDDASRKHHESAHASAAGVAAKARQRHADASAELRRHATDQEAILHGITRDLHDEVAAADKAAGEAAARHNEASRVAAQAVAECDAAERTFAASKSDADWAKVPPAKERAERASVIAKHTADDVSKAAATLASAKLRCKSEGAKRLYGAARADDFGSAYGAELGRLFDAGKALCEAVAAIDAAIADHRSRHAIATEAASQGGFTHHVPPAYQLPTTRYMIDLANIALGEALGDRAPVTIAPARAVASYGRPALGLGDERVVRLMVARAQAKASPAA